jgi:protein-L-isoaspartate(D-aspartate) O-methyltransferase
MIPLRRSGDPANGRPDIRGRVFRWAWLAVLLLVGTALGLCVGLWLARLYWPADGDRGPEPEPARPAVAGDGPRPGPEPADEDEREWTRQRRQMVDRQLVLRGIEDQRVLAAMRRVPRHRFVPDRVRNLAYADTALPIGHEQTISQPYVVALMTEAAGPQPKHRVLEVGTGSGYQAAVLAELVEKVCTIELVPELAKEAGARLERLGYRNVEARQGDGYLGWPEAAPFDAILVTCGADHVPGPLFEQLKVGGKMVIPVGDPPARLWLRLITKGADGKQQSRDLIPVRFVPLRRPAEGQPK